MPNRILKDSICTSPNIDVLSRDAEVFFYRLLVQCDDFGRMDARPAILRAKCYPLQIDTVTQESVKGWLAELVRAELVITYTVDGGDYLQFRTWERHQQIRAKRSKYPDMIADDSKRNHDVKSSDINCNQVQANVPVIQSNPIQQEPVASNEQLLSSSASGDSAARYRHVCKLIENNGFGMLTPMMADQVHIMLDEFTDEWIEHAFEVAIKANKRRLDYVLGTLENIRRDGIKGKPKATTNGRVNDSDRHVANAWEVLMQQSAGVQ